MSWWFNGGLMAQDQGQGGIFWGSRYLRFFPWNFWDWSWLNMIEAAKNWDIMGIIMGIHPKWRSLLRSAGSDTRLHPRKTSNFGRLELRFREFAAVESFEQFQRNTGCMGGIGRDIHSVRLFSFFLNWDLAVLIQSDCGFNGIFMGFSFWSFLKTKVF
jgi:hypothetical protein